MHHAFIFLRNFEIQSKFSEYEPSSISCERRRITAATIHNPTVVNNLPLSTGRPSSRRVVFRYRLDIARQPLFIGIPRRRRQASRRRRSHCISLRHLRLLRRNQYSPISFLAHSFFGTLLRNQHKIHTVLSINGADEQRILATSGILHPQR